MESVKQFLKSLIRPPYYMELRAVHLNDKKSGVPTKFIQNVNDIDSFITKHGRDREIFMGVASRINPDKGGGLDNCALPTALWVDADDEKAARAELSLFELEPSVIIHSGHGLHLYWMLNDKPENQDQVKRVLQQLARRLEGDMSCAELARVMRVPGTMNHKSPLAPVRIEYINLNQRYKFQEILNATIPTAHKSAAFLKGRAWMAELDPAIEGEHGDDGTYKVACMFVRDLGLDDDDVIELMREWNQRCVPPWTDAELFVKINNAKKHGKGTVGAADPAQDFEEIVAFENDNDDFVVKSKKAWLKETYKIVNDGGVLRMYRTVRDETLHRDKWESSRLKDFLEVCHYAHLLPLVDSGKTRGKEKIPIYEPMAQVWLDSRNGKQTFNGLTMRPDCNEERTPDGMLNMWKGFVVKPQAGSWSLLKELIFEAFCQWDMTSYNYISDWLARAVQCPWEPAGTALVLKGEKGIGKGTLGRTFIELFGQHGCAFSSRELLTGRFNDHPRDCVALFADEAYYAGDKAGESMLKSFITEPALMYEGKGKNPVMGRNYLHIIMASNSDWVVPAGMDSERRFAVFEVEKWGNGAFFRKLNYELNHGGREAMLYELLNRNISKFDVWQIPQTAALAAQKVHEMDPLVGWLLNMADDRWINFVGEKGEFRVQQVHTSFLDYCEKRNLRSRHQNDVSFGMTLKKYMPEGFKKFRKMENGRQENFYDLPDAEKTAEHIRKMLGIEQEELRGMQNLGQGMQDGNL